MRRAKRLGNEQGLTIMELMIAASILLVVLALSYNFYGYYYRSFELGTSRSNVQQNVRLAKMIIEDQMRLSGFIRIGSAPANPGDYNRIYVSSNKIMLYDKDTGETRDIMGSISENIDMQLTFRKSSESFIEITVSGSISGGQSYEISSELLILKGDAVIANAIDDQDSGIYYSPPD